MTLGKGYFSDARKSYVWYPRLLLVPWAVPLHSRDIGPAFTGLRPYKHRSAGAGCCAYFVPGTDHPHWAPGLSESAPCPMANYYECPWPILLLPGFLVSRLLTSLPLDWISQDTGQCMDSLGLQPQLRPAPATFFVYRNSNASRPASLRRVRSSYERALESGCPVLPLPRCISLLGLP